MLRKIIHIDMDCFYAAIEMREDPKLQKTPLAIGGDEGRRGVLCTCNYIARQYGVRSAMPSFKAKQLCPSLVILPPRFELYRQESQAIRKIFTEYTELIEPLSLDEAYLDVSESSHHKGSATLIAEDIRQQIWQQRRLTASAGVATNKLIAKIASDENKPNGICIISPEKVASFIANLAVKKLFGVGPKLQQKLTQLGIETCFELQQLPLQSLVSQFGKMGVNLYQYSRGIDNRAVMVARKRKSISVEWTFEQDLQEDKLIENTIKVLFERLKRRWQLAGEPQYHKVFVKLKLSDFSIQTKEQKIAHYSVDIFKLIIKELRAKHAKPIRLLGLGLRLKQETDLGQLELDFDSSNGDMCYAD